MTETRDIVATVKRILMEQFDVPEGEIKAEAVLVEDLGLDDLGHMNFVLALEKAFEIDIPDEDVPRIRTVQNAVSYSEALIKR